MESLTLYTKYGQSPAHGEMSDMRWKIRRFWTNIKTNGFPVWYKKQTPVQLHSMESWNEEREKIEYEHFCNHFANHE